MFVSQYSLIVVADLNEYFFLDVFINLIVAAQGKIYQIVMISNIIFGKSSILKLTFYMTASIKSYL